MSQVATADAPALQPDPPKKTSHLAHLDGIRGGAALWVLLAHCQIWCGWSRLIPDPKIAVDVFMLISGYLMLQQWEANRQGEPTWGKAGRFWLRRFFRVAPLYYAVLAAAAVLARPYANGYAALQAANPSLWRGPLGIIYDPTVIRFDWANVLTHVTFTFGFIPRYVWSTFLPDWSLALEAQFYAAFPLLLLAFRRLGAASTTLLCLAGSVVVTKLIGHLPEYRPGAGVAFSEPSLLPMKIAFFLAGMLAAEANRSFVTHPSRGAGLAMIAAVVACAQPIVVGVVAILFCLPSCRDGEGRRADGHRAVSRLLGNRLTRFMADTSYAVYLIHGFFVALVGSRLTHLPPFARTMATTAVTLVGSYAVAWVLHVLVERPAIQLGKRVTSRGSAATVIAPPGI